MTKLFLGWLTFLVVALIFSYTIAEPYPTFIMPGFARVFDYSNNQFERIEPELLFVDGSVQSVMDYKELFPNLKAVHPNAIMRNLFTSNHIDRTLVDTTSRSIYQRLKYFRYTSQQWMSEHFPRVYGRAIQDRGHDSATIAWLRRQLQPKSDSAVLHINWMKTIGIPSEDGAMRVSESVRIDSMIIKLY
jgi:hypothetical protein